jgi:hypothetical protein
MLPGMRMTRAERAFFLKLQSRAGKQAWATIPPEERSEILRQRALKREARKRREREQQQLQEA